jgi:hypothetical protein
LFTKAASAGDNSAASAAGKFSKAASAGERSEAVSDGERSKAASNGDYSKAASAGENSGAIAIGFRAAAKGDLGNLLMVSEYTLSGVPIGGKADLVDGKTLKPGCWYIVEDGQWTEVDFTDGISAYVLATYKNYKKVKTFDGSKTLYIAYGDDDLAAHGDTLGEAKEALVYKACATYEGVLPDKATIKEWIPIYRGITGACPAGVRLFIQGLGKELLDEITLQDVVKLTAGQYGHEKFKDIVDDNN